MVCIKSVAASHSHAPFSAAAPCIPTSHVVLATPTFALLPHLASLSTVIPGVPSSGPCVLPCCAALALVRWRSTFSHVRSCPCPMHLPPPPPHEDSAYPQNGDCPTCGGLVTALLPSLWWAPPGAWGTTPNRAESAGSPRGGPVAGRVWRVLHYVAALAFALRGPSVCCGQAFFFVAWIPYPWGGGGVPASLF